MASRVWLCGLLAFGLFAAGCVPPDEPVPATSIVPADAPLSTVEAETLDEFRPDGVVFRVSFVLPADEVNRFNSQYWEFVAPDEVTLLAAAQQLKTAANAAGWVSESDFAAGADGVFTASFTKGQMVLSVTYTTAASFSLSDFDDDELLLTAEIVIDPSLPEVGS